MSFFQLPRVALATRIQPGTFCGALLKLPSTEACSNDQFLFNLRAEDKREFLATSKKSGNQAFLTKRRFYYSYELIKKYLSKNTDTFRVADFACGTGNVGLLLAQDGYKVDFVDNEENFFEYIKLKHTKGDINFA